MSLVYWESFQIQEHYKSFDGDVPKTVHLQHALSLSMIDGHCTIMSSILWDGSLIPAIEISINIVTGMSWLTSTQYWNTWKNLTQLRLLQSYPSIGIEKESRV